MEDKELLLLFITSTREAVDSLDFQHYINNVSGTEFSQARTNLLNIFPNIWSNGN